MKVSRRGFRRVVPWNADCVIFKSVPLDKKEILLTVPSDTPIMTCILHCPLFVSGAATSLLIPYTPAQS